MPFIAGDLGIELFQIETDHDADIGIGSDLGQLAFDIERIDVDHRAAGLEHSEITDHRIGRVRQADADADTLAHAELTETFGGFRNEIAEFGVIVFAPEEIDCRLPAVFGDRVVEQRPKRAGRYRRVPADAGRIGFLPDIRAFHGARRLYFGLMALPGEQVFYFFEHDRHRRCVPPGAASEARLRAILHNHARPCAG
jgi:hypothetical protein